MVTKKKKTVKRKTTKSVKRKPVKRKTTKKRPVKRKTIIASKRLEKQTEDFGEEIKGLSNRMEKHACKFERKTDVWWFRTFGFIGAFIKTLFGFLFFVIGVWFLKLVNYGVESSAVEAITTFLLANLLWFFILFLFVNYNKYFARRYPETHWIVKPITTSVIVTFWLWIIVWVMDLLNLNAGNILIAELTSLFYSNLAAIFIGIVAFGYALIIVKTIFVKLWKD